MDIEFETNIFFNDSFNTYTDWRPPIIEDIFMSTISISATVGNLFIVYSIARNKHLQTKRNLLIFNWALSDFFNQIFNASLHEFFFYITGYEIFNTYFCIIYEIQYYFTNLTMVFVLILFIDCFYDRITAKTMPFFWILFSLGIIPEVTFCINDTFLDISYKLMHLLFSSLALSAFVKIILCLIRGIQRKPYKCELRVILSATYMLCWSFGGSFEVISMFVNLHSLTYRTIGMIGLYIGTLNSFITAVLLINLDREFKMEFYKIFKCFGSENDMIPYERENSVENEAVLDSNISEII